MPLELRKVSQDAEFNEIIQCECDGYANPPNRIWRLFRHDPSPAGFIELRDRQIREFRNEPAACWLKVVDTDIGDKVVGVAQWNIYTENPYPEYKEHPLEAYWWPEGELFVPRKRCVDGRGWKSVCCTLAYTAVRFGRRIARVRESPSRSICV